MQTNLSTLLLWKATGIHMQYTNILPKEMKKLSKHYFVFFCNVGVEGEVRFFT